MANKVLYRVRIQRKADYKGCAVFWCKSRTRKNLIHHQVISLETGRVLCTCDYGRIHYRCEPHYWEIVKCHHISRALKVLERRGELPQRQCYVS